MIPSQNPKPAILAVLQLLVEGLENRFPNGNGPFEYATRLCEEIGELSEELVKLPDEFVWSKASERDHFIKETQDVLRVILGLARVYELSESFNGDLASYNSDSPKASPREYLVRLTIAAGQVASTVSHAEGKGVKAEKYGDEPKQRLRSNLDQLLSICADIVRNAGIDGELDRQIRFFVEDYVHRGYIKTNRID